MGHGGQGEVSLHIKQDTVHITTEKVSVLAWGIFAHRSFLLWIPGVTLLVSEVPAVSRQSQPEGGTGRVGLEKGRIQISHFLSSALNSPVVALSSP